MSLPVVLIADKLAPSTVAALGDQVEVRWVDGPDREKLLAAVPEADALLVRSATTVDAEVLAAAPKLKIVARAGVGLDNVDVDAATARGVLVVNAPTSNIHSAAEHALALLLSAARQIPAADATLREHTWKRSAFSGTEIFGKTVGVVGLGRIGQLVAQRLAAFGTHVVAYDPYVSTERYRELGVEKADSSTDVYRQADFITIHLPKTPETRGWLDAAAFAEMKDGVRVINCARGELVVDDALKHALDSGKVAGAALDVFPSEPITDYPLFSGYDNVVVTPHLGASTTEAQDRAGVQTAEQVVAALTGGVVSTAVNIPAISAEDMEVLGPFVPLAEKLGKIAASLADSVERVEIEHLGRIAERDTRLLTLSVLTGLFTGRTEEAVNLVNAPTLAEERGITIAETRETQAKDYADLVRVTLVGKDGAVRVVGTTLGQKHRPHLLEAWGQRFNLQIDDPYLTLFRYSDVPGMVGRVGSSLGEAGVNISAAAVGRQAPGEGESSDLAVMAITTDGAVPDSVIAQIASSDGFVSGRSIALG